MTKAARRLAHTAIQRPGRTLLVAGLLTLASAAGVLRLEIDTDGRALVPASAPEVVADRAVRDAFDLRDPIAVVLRADGKDGVFDPATLRRVERLSADLERLPGVRPFDVVSLATEPGFRHRPRSLTFAALLETFPDTPELLDRLRSDLARIRLYEGILTSHDGSGAAILVGTPPDVDRRRLVHQIQRLAAASAVRPPDGGGEAVAVLGAPVAEAFLGRHILADLGIPEAFLRKSPDLWRGADGDNGRRARFRPGMVPLALAVMGLVFLLAFRRPAAALLPLTEIGACLAIVFGVMGWLGVPVYLTTSVLPVILAAMGAADEIHIFRRFLDLDPLRAGDDDAYRGVVTRALDEMAPPVVHTSVTTAVAFLSFALSPIGPVRAFGLFTAFGVLVCMVWSLTVIPALLALLGPRPWVGGGAAREASRRRGAFARLARLGARRRHAVLVVALLATLAAADGIRRLTVQDSWIDGFAPESAFARATRYFDRQFLGSHLLRLSVEAEPYALAGRVGEVGLGSHELRLPGPELPVERLAESWIRLFQVEMPEAAAASRRRRPREWTTWVESVEAEGGEIRLTMPRRGGSARFWLRPRPGDEVGYEILSEPFMKPSLLRRVAELESFLAEQPGVGGVLGPARYLETTSFMLSPDAEGSRRLPADPKAAKNLWNNYGQVRGPERLARLVDPDFRRALVTVFLEGANFAATARLEKAIREFERQRLAPHGLRLAFAGDVAVSQALIGAVVSTQVRSVLLSLVGIFAAAALLLRSLRYGLYCVLPPAFAVAINFAAMGWLGIPLGVATSMFAGMTLGVGVDFAIHLLARRRLARERGLRGEAGLAAALEGAGPAIVIDGLAVGLGFGALMLSQVPANARLGGLLMASVLGCLAATLVLIPAMVGGERCA